VRSELDSLRSVRIELRVLQAVRGIEVGAERTLSENMRLADPFTELGTFVLYTCGANGEREICSMLAMRGYRREIY
jgi:hypothetical protein